MSLMAELGIEIPEAAAGGGGRGRERILAYLVAMALECRGQGFAPMVLPELFHYILRDFPECQKAVDEIRADCSGQLIFAAWAMREAAAGRRPKLDGLDKLGGG